MLWIAGGDARATDACGIMAGTAARPTGIIARAGNTSWRSGETTGMMKLQLMREFFDTVDAGWRSPLATAIAGPWRAIAADPVIWRASANFVCGMLEPPKKYVLRFNHASERDARGIEAELQFVRHCANRGVSVASPIALPSGEYTASVQTSMGVFHAVLFEALPGAHKEFDNLAEDDWPRWGEALGRLHSASERCTAIERPSCFDHIAWALREIPPAEAPAISELECIQQALSQLKPDRASFGLIHYDFELDNLKWCEDQVHILDFDDCAYYWYEADLAYALRDLFQDSVAGVDHGNARLAQFLRGYRAVRPLADAALQRLPLFLRLHNLVMFCKLLRSLGDGALPEEPEWMAGLRAKLGGMIDRYRRDFLEHPIRNYI
jgi:Ser/Thr protein kinase RdoA (MazF antagonist)